MSAYLLAELARVKAENERLKARLRRATRSRDKYRAAAWYLKRATLGQTHHGPPPRFIQEAQTGVSYER